MIDQEILTIDDTSSQGLSKCKALLNDCTFLIRVSLFKEDIQGSFEPPVFYLKVRKSSYLEFHLEEIKDFFDYYALILDRNQNWIGHRGKPLNWDLPFGVLFDLNFTNEEYRNCINLTFYYRRLVDTPLASKRKDYIKDSILHSLKESAYIRSGKQDLIKLELSPQEADLYVKLIQEQRFPEAELVLAKLKPFYNKGKIPVKFFLKDSSVVVSKSCQSGDLLITALNSSFADAFKCPGELKTEFKSLKAFSSGIELSFDMKMGDISDIFGYPDGWNYIILTLH